MELELKAVVPDPAALGKRLRDAGFGPTFTGRMRDRRFDRNGEFAAVGEVVRVRAYQGENGIREVIGWKGTTSVNADGYKQREEVESGLCDGAPGDALLERLGFGVVHAIDRFVEIFDVYGAMLRIEWYPDADTLLEVEGDGAAIERAIGITGLERTGFTSEPLVAFAERFQERSGRPARLALLHPDEFPEHWPQ
ncbi:MAG: hypothetical protein V4503_11865 [Gemmatimonadota bacterium]